MQGCKDVQPLLRSMPRASHPTCWPHTSEQALQRGVPLSTSHCCMGPLVERLQHVEAARCKDVCRHGGKPGGGERRRWQLAGELLAGLWGCLLLRRADRSAHGRLTLEAPKGGAPGRRCRPAPLLRPVLIAALTLRQRADGAAAAAGRGSKPRHCLLPVSSPGGATNRKRIKNRESCALAVGWHMLRDTAAANQLPRCEALQQNAAYSRWSRGNGWQESKADQGKAVARCRGGTGALRTVAAGRAGRVPPASGTHTGEVVIVHASKAWAAACCRGMPRPTTKGGGVPHRM